MRGKLDDLTGKKFGRLVVQRFSHSDRRNKFASKSYWECFCECGKTTIVYSGHLKNSHTTSCGCLASSISLSHLQNSVFSSYRCGARERGLSFELPCDMFVFICQSDCLYCGAPPSNSKTYTSRLGSSLTWKYNGIDRLLNTDGYNVANCVPCCFQCNRAKMDQSAEDFINHCKLVASRH